MKHGLIIGAALLAAFALASNGVRFEARMGGGPGKAKAKWKIDNRSQFQAEFEAEGERLNRNTNYFVHVADHFYTVTTNEFGRFNIEIRITDPAQSLPIAAGTGVTLENAKGDIILSGVFAQVN